MIVVTRLGGGEFGVNPDLIQRIDSAPDAILTLIDGTKYIVAEPMSEVITRINDHRATILSRAQEIQSQPRIELVPDLDDADDDEPAAPPRFDRGRSTDTDDKPLAPAVPFRPRSV
ncbi:flagellar FlbD family protein [Cellulomonas sp. URHE0023]|uniref:flagellar FlbD family protein n=1 Tax=Cellulomonas sp. URHE0023 TaxID=1380354 RepID=UPI000482C3C8|nr:flagellar FlbD family protein [Cellulomonas sp. URHE0023]